MFAGIRSRWALKKARSSSRKKQWSGAVSHAINAHKLDPTCWEGIDRVLHTLEMNREWEPASTLLRATHGQSDPLQEMRFRLSYYQEQREALAGQARVVASGRSQLKVALFNDTDFRPNIGCRLTSRGLKSAIVERFPGAEIVSLPFDFTSFRGAQDEGDDWEGRMRRAYGKGARDALEGADIVVLQPEGSLDAGISAGGLKNFFAPIPIAAARGKPSIIVNGTIPRLGDERKALVSDILSRATRTAARDRHTAEYYGIEFIADAALLYPTASNQETVVRDGLLITTGARNDAAEDHAMVDTALKTAVALGLRPVVLTRNVRRAAGFRDEISRLGGIFADTASLAEAERMIGSCRLHVGARYHMAIFSLLCGTPTLLYAEETGKNAWLPELSSLIRLVQPRDDLLGAAARMIDEARVPFEGREALLGQYVRLFDRVSAERDTIAPEG